MRAGALRITLLHACCECCQTFRLTDFIYIYIFVCMCHGILSVTNHHSVQHISVLVAELQDPVAVEEHPVLVLRHQEAA